MARFLRTHIGIHMYMQSHTSIHTHESQWKCFISMLEEDTGKKSSICTYCYSLVSADKSPHYIINQVFNIYLF